MQKKQLIKWFVEGLEAYNALPQARLPACNKMLFAHGSCCGWHSGVRVLYNHLVAIGGQILPQSEVVVGQSGRTPDVLSLAWLKEFRRRYPDHTGVGSSVSGSPPRSVVRSGRLPHWVVEAHKAWSALDRTQQFWCNTDGLVYGTCCGWHVAIFLMMGAHLKFQADKLLTPAGLPLDKFPTFSVGWWRIFTEEYDLPNYQP